VLIVMVVVPILFGFPAVVSSIPPLVILIPAALPFCVQIPSPLLGFVAVLALFLDGSVEPRFCFFNCMLTLASVIGPRLRCCYDEPQYARYYECHCYFC
jgi:hypothetical protein